MWSAVQFLLMFFLHFFLVLQRLIVTCRRISRISRLRAFSDREQEGGPHQEASPICPADLARPIHRHLRRRGGGEGQEGGLTKQMRKDCEDRAGKWRDWAHRRDRPAWGPEEEVRRERGLCGMLGNY